MNLLDDINVNDPLINCCENCINACGLSHTMMNKSDRFICDLLSMNYMPVNTNYIKSDKVKSIRIEFVKHDENKFIIVEYDSNIYKEMIRNIRRYRGSAYPTVRTKSKYLIIKSKEKLIERLTKITSKGYTVTNVKYNKTNLLKTYFGTPVYVKNERSYIEYIKSYMEFKKEHKRLKLLNYTPSIIDSTLSTYGIDDNKKYYQYFGVKNKFDLFQELL